MTSATQPLAARITSGPVEWVEMPAAGRPLETALRESRGLLAVVVAQVLASTLICVAAGLPILAGPLDALTTFFAAVAVFGTMAFIADVFRRRLLQPSSLPIVSAYRRAWMEMRAELLTREYLAVVAITFLAIPLAISACSAAKQAIPILHPFTWDPVLSSIAARVDGGHPLWQRLQPILGKPEITSDLDWFYHRAWTTLILAVVVWTGLSRPSANRRRFLIAFVLLMLVVGNLLALALASAGPAYYGLLAHGAQDPYAGLVVYLRSVDAHTPLLSVRGEQVLWYAYRHHVEALGYGISAMPSMHVASAALMAFFGFRFSRLLGVVLLGVAACTFAGSVALGWHYTLDGYVGAATAGVVWFVAGRIARAVG